MTVSMRVMSAGDGYKYLLRAVAAGDGDRSLSTPLTRYYVEAGSPPGFWLGSGLPALSGGAIHAGDRVSEAQLGVDPFSEHLTARRVGHAACTAAWSLLRTHDQPVVVEQAQAIAASRPGAPSVLFLGEPGKGKSTLVRLLSPHATSEAMEEQLVNRYRH